MTELTTANRALSRLRPDLPERRTAREEVLK
jgi:hypothetical protein